MILLASRMNLQNVIGAKVILQKKTVGTLCSVFWQGELSFRQSPTFQDCFPGSEKCYNEIEHNGKTLRVRG